MIHLRSIILIASVLFLFVGNIGIDIFKHVCEEDGVYVSYFVNTGDDHCDENKKDVPPCCDQNDEDDCCDDEVSYFQIKLDNRNPKPISYLPQITFFASKPEVHCNHLVFDHYCSNYVTPPPPDGREILLKKEVLVI